MTEVTGFITQISNAELKGHLVARAEHHDGRAAFYAKHAAELKAGGAEAGQFSNGDSVENLRRKGSEHAQKSLFFKYAATHLVPDATYRLELKELRDLELVKVDGLY